MEEEKDEKGGQSSGEGGLTKREVGVGGYRVRGEIWNMEYFAERNRGEEGGKGRWEEKKKSGEEKETTRGKKEGRKEERGWKEVERAGGVRERKKGARGGREGEGERNRERGRVIQCPPRAVVAMGTPISPWELTSEFHNPLASCLGWNTINTHANTQAHTDTHTRRHTQANRRV